MQSRLRHSSLGMAIGVPFYNRKNYEPEIDLLMGSLTTGITESHKSKLNKLVIDLKDTFNKNALSEKFDCIWVTGNYTKEISYKNLVKRQHDCTDIVAPTWVQYEGIQGNNSEYVDTNFSPASGVNYTQDDNSFGVYVRDTKVADSNYALGINDGGGSWMSLINPHRYLDQYKVYNNGGGSVTASNGGTAVGITGCMRTGNNSIAGIKNKTLTGGTGLSKPMPDMNFYLMGVNMSGVPSFGDSLQIALAWFGGSFTQTELNGFVDSIEYYLDSVGVGVL